MLKKILLLLRPAEILLLLGLSLFALLANLGLLGASAWLISSAALLPPLYALTLGITAVRALGISRAVLRYGERYFTHRTAFRVLSALRLHLYDIVRAQASFPQTQKDKGTILNTLLGKVDILRDFLLRGILPPLVLLVVILLFTLLLAPQLSYGVLLLPLLYLLHYLPLWLCPAKDNTASSYHSQLLDFAQGCHELQLAGSLPIATKKLDQSARRWQEQTTSEQRRIQRIDCALSLLRSLAFVLFFALLIDAASQKQISGITMGLWLLMLLALLRELSLLPAALNQLRQAQLAAIWLQETTAVAPPAPQTPLHELLSVSQLTFHYPQSLPVFSQLTFSVSPGCHTAIIGDSGSGKTTLAYLLAGLWQPTAGTIQYGYSYTPFVCTIPQGSFLFSASIRENFLRLYPGIQEDKLKSALQQAQLEAVIDKLPQGIDTPLGENACTLSGGERNRLTSALILASSSPLLLFDEPTAGLDKKTADSLLTAILDQANRTRQTVLLITHDLPQLNRFQQTICLHPQSTRKN
ncbi:MAG: ATP-binding cassette domain-containing protein [Selenomonas sp.]|uniref:amino acid ABC transporter ATP-binding/permease protein n=1 Tax=Selenomonas sp. TaxID=2053611 RepID=UPI0025ED1711|nr:ATP-binding cassette domain-containing protein [Selenomonas sp.]MCR5756802.1 ATP-binding cassette domain-containing protein [Selenomonas sp.]